MVVKQFKKKKKKVMLIMSHQDPGVAPRLPDLK